MEKIAKNMKMDWEGLSKWAKVRMIPSVLSYDVWNALFPQDSRYDFMGREIARGGMFKDDKSNDITLEFSRLSKEGEFPTISDPTGAYAVSLEERLGEAPYQEMLSGFKKTYASEVQELFGESKYKSSTDKKKKKMIDKIRSKEILKALKEEEKKYE